MRRGLAVCAALLVPCLAGCEEGSSAPDAGSAATEADAGSEADAGPRDAARADADTSEPEPGPVDLVHSALWNEVEAGDDPFPPPAPVDCPRDSFGTESLGGELVFYVRTEKCSAISVRQASRADVSAGQTLRVRMFYFPLTAPDVASARLIVQLGDDVVMERELPIPSPAGRLEQEWVAASDYARGTPVTFHVDNHGENEYALIAIERL